MAFLAGLDISMIPCMEMIGCWSSSETAVVYSRDLQGQVLLAVKIGEAAGRL
jgi:hypothetical protein